MHRAQFMLNVILGSRIVVTTLACCLLAGCFSSDAPKFTLASAVAALGEGGRYEVFERIADGQYRRQETFVVQRRADGAYDFANKEGKVVPISLHAIGGDLFVGQARVEKEKVGYGYLVFRIKGNEALVHIPLCDDQDKAKLADLGVTPPGGMECGIDRVADPGRFFAGLNLGEPTSKMLHE